MDFNSIIHLRIHHLGLTLLIFFTSVFFHSPSLSDFIPFVFIFLPITLSFPFSLKFNLFCILQSDIHFSPYHYFIHLLLPISFFLYFSIKYSFLSLWLFHSLSYFIPFVFFNQIFITLSFIFSFIFHSFWIFQSDTYFSLSSFIHLLSYFIPFLLFDQKFISFLMKFSFTISFIFYSFCIFQSDIYFPSIHSFIHFLSLSIFQMTYLPTSSLADTLFHLLDYDKPTEFINWYHIYLLFILNMLPK